MIPGIFVIKRNTACVISTPAKNKNFKTGELFRLNWKQCCKNKKQHWQWCSLLQNNLKIESIKSHEGAIRLPATTTLLPCLWPKEWKIVKSFLSEALSCSYAIITIIQREDKHILWGHASWPPGNFGRERRVTCCRRWWHGCALRWLRCWCLRLPTEITVRQTVNENEKKSWNLIWE